MKNLLVSSAALVAVLLPAVAGAQVYPLHEGPLSASATEVGPGGTLQVSGSGFAPGASVVITFESAPVTLKSTTADGAGAINTAVVIPSDASPGQHTVKATGPAGDGGTLVLSAQVTVAGSAAPATPVSGTSFALTGTEARALVAIGGILLTVGVALVLVTRRRHSS